jgi:hypothetical protein
MLYRALAGACARARVAVMAGADDTMTDCFSRIVIQQSSAFRSIYLALLESIRARHHCVIHLYCNTKQDAKFYAPYLNSGLVDSITRTDVLYQAIGQRDLDEETVLSCARAREAKLGTTINRLAVTDRHLGRGYALGGFYHPRSHYSEQTNYLQMVHGYNELVDFWACEIAEKRPTLMISCGLVAELLAKAGGIPVRSMIGSRYQNYYYWGRNEFYETPEVEVAYHGLEDAPETGDVDPYLSHMSLRKKFLRNTTLRGLARRMVHLTARNFYWRLRRYDKAKAYFLKDELAYFWREWRDTRKLNGAGALSVADLGPGQIVYYPLHTEPETALQALSPEYFYQLSCIAALSRDLPAGVRLAVKETYAGVGRRPTDFYAQIREFKNVVMIRMMELGPEVIQRADAVATITGTGGFEAAVMGKPVLTFGRHNIYNFLPHVLCVTDEGKLKSQLAAALSGEIDAARAQQDGARFLAAVKATSFDLRDFNMVDLKRFDPTVIEAANDKLCESLSRHEDAAAAI